MTDMAWPEGVSFAGIMPPLKENFKHHDLIIVLNPGEGEGISFKVECRGADKEECVCDVFCQVKDTIDMVGLWDCIKSAGEIELARLSARMDWTDPEEPWVEVEP